MWIDYNRSSFKYILDHTFFRPRDLLLFFQPLAQHDYDFPLSKYSINQLIGKYCTEVVNELKNEFSCFYSTNQIAMIFNAFMEMNDNLSYPNVKSVSYEKAIEIIDKHCRDVDAKFLIEDMFYRSLIGNMKDNGHVFFKHREPSNDTYKFNKNYGIIMHNALKVYCKGLS